MPNESCADTSTMNDRIDEQRVHMIVLNKHKTKRMVLVINR